MLLKDQVALIAGANRGIGRAVAKRFAEEGSEGWPEHAGDDALFLHPIHAARTQHCEQKPVFFVQVSFFP